MTSNIRRANHDWFPRIINWMASENPWDEGSDEPYDDKGLCGMQKLSETRAGPRGSEEAKIEEQDGGFGHADND